jgi:hypothetical protein
VQPPKSYNNLIVTFESRAETNLNIEFVTFRLLHEELKKKDVESSNERRSTLVVCTSKATFNNSTANQEVAIKRDKNKYLCNYCKKPSHWA